MSENFTYHPHKSILLDKILEILKENLEDFTYFVDGTFGGGGHSFAVQECFPQVQVLACDQDPDALKNAENEIEKRGLKDKVYVFSSNFENFPQILNSDEISVKPNAVLLDIGVSSHQFDAQDRGFSYNKDALLDMRMNFEDDSLKTAADYLAEMSEEELVEVLTVYGEERFAKNIASNIVNERVTNPIRTTKELENLIFHSYPKKLRHSGSHPATKTFQALRILVNDELGVLERSIVRFWDLLEKDGLLMIITFHSLEDRIVKNLFKKLCLNDDEVGKILTKKPLIPDDEEIHHNKRARSAKLRVLQKSQRPKKPAWKRKKSSESL